ncbi:MAG: hypothetical protein KDC44_04310, partial [Phaeodactylibacter sp.]|nr:hypothetical protein [Phaeodactylibacter sp.]
IQNRMACLTLGDAGAAVILDKGTTQASGFQSIDLQTYGGYSHLCIAKEAATGGWIMLTDSVNLTGAALTAGAQHSIAALRQTGWPADSFQHLIMHQTSRMTLNSARQEINRLLGSNICHNGNTINNLTERGNTSSTSHFIALSDQIQNGQIQSGDKIVFSISASGLTIGTALYTMDDLPDRIRRSQAPKTWNPPTDIPHTAVPAAKNPVAPRVRVESIGTLPLQADRKANSLEALTQAAKQALKTSIHQANDIGLLLYTGLYRTDYVLEPAYAALVAGELGMNSVTSATVEGKTFAFDIFNGAIGFLNACYLAQQMIAAENCQAAMILAAEIENNAENFPDELLGIQEAASALILDAGAANSKGFSQFLFRYELSAMHAYTTHTVVEDTNLRLTIHKAQNLEDLYLELIIPTVQELLERAGLSLEQIDKIFPPQISSAFINRLGNALGLPAEKFVDIAGAGPDLFSSSIPYALEHALLEGLVKEGATGLLIAVGSGLQAGCALYHF